MAKQKSRIADIKKAQRKLPTAADLGRQLAEDRKLETGKLHAVIGVGAGNAPAFQRAISLPFTRALSMAEMQLLWNTERALNAMPLPAGYRVVIVLENS